MRRRLVKRLIRVGCTFTVLFLMLGVGIIGCLGVYAQTEEAKDTCGLYIINADGQGLSQLTFGKELNPRWSPDGERILYLASGAIYVMNKDGSGRVKILDSGSYPVWSPDGERIAYSRIQYPTTYEIYVINADGANPVCVSYDGAYPAWSPDSKQIAFCGERSGIFVVNADGTNERILSNDNGTAPNWSPDGKRIAYHRYLDLGMSEIVVMNADGSGILSMADDGEFPVWSPDGKQIIFSEINANGIYVLSADGTNLIHLVGEQGYSYQNFVWSPDATRIAYTRYKYPDTNEIYVINTDGTNKVLLTNTGSNPTWSSDGRIAFSGVCD